MKAEYPEVKLAMGETAVVSVAVNRTEFSEKKFTVRAQVDESIATVEVKNATFVGLTYRGDFIVTGVFLGKTQVIAIIGEEGETAEIKGDVFTVSVVRRERVIDSVFTASVAVLVSILYINFGCAIDWEVCRATLKRPVGPAIGYLCQFGCMPLLSYGLGKLFFPERPEMQLGLFFTGISPSGGASNIWTVLLGGNLTLSVTLTTLCTLAAFGTMPFWTFTLGQTIFDQGNMTVPYWRIATFAFGLLIPLGVGLFLQRKFPRISKILVRMMKPFSIVLVLFIIVFAIITNAFLFRLFSLKIILVGMALPWIGFLFGLLVSTIFRQPRGDIIAIAIETGIQNTGVAIYLLRFTLHSPADDLTTIVPVSIAIMTPVPLAILFVIKLARDKLIRKAASLQSPMDETYMEKLEKRDEIPTISLSSRNRR